MLWHGRGGNERRVLHPLARALQDRGVVALVPDWDITSPDGGVRALRRSLELGAGTAADRRLPLVVAGWSLGGAAALSVALGVAGMPRPDGVIGLGANPSSPSPLDGVPPADRLTEVDPATVPPIHLVHGTDDGVVLPSASAGFTAGAVERGIRCSLRLVATDHAGVVGTVYDPEQRLCVPHDGEAARTGRDAAVRAVLEAAGRGER